MIDIGQLGQLGQLLETVKGINAKYETLYNSTGENFNIFNITGISSKEVIICRIISELINPSGMHFQKDLYLRAFVTLVLKLDLSDEEYSHIKVYTEYLIEEQRRIDIVIKTEGCVSKLFIPIEVKLYAGDQNSQCYDYIQKAINSNLYYLTLDGHQPSEESVSSSDGKCCLEKCRGTNSEDIFFKDLTCLSFATDIIPWLEECLRMPATIKLAPIREILQQFIRILKDMTNQMGDEELREIAKILGESPEKMRLADIIDEAKIEAQEDLLKRIFNAFEDKIGQENTNQLTQTTLATQKKDCNGDVKKNREELITQFCRDKKNSYPNLSYYCRKLSIDEGEVDILFRIEVETYMYFGFCAIDNNGEKIKSKIVQSALKPIFKAATNKAEESVIKYDAGWWFFYQPLHGIGNGTVPIFKGSNHNAAYYALYNQKKFDSFIDASYEEMKRVVNQYFGVDLKI